jgi:hypothetical protein
VRLTRDRGASRDHRLPRPSSPIGRHRQLAAVPDTRRGRPAWTAGRSGGRLERVRAQHRREAEHLWQNQREQEARAKDVRELRAAASAGKKFSPHHEDDEAADKRRTLLTIEALQGEAREAEVRVRSIAAEVAEQYRAELAQRSEQLRQAVQGGVEAIRARLVELRTATYQTWLDQVTTPGFRSNGWAWTRAALTSCWHRSSVCWPDRARSTWRTTCRTRGQATVARCSRSRPARSRCRRRRDGTISKGDSSPWNPPKEARMAAWRVG